MPPSLLPRNRVFPTRRRGGIGTWLLLGLPVLVVGTALGFRYVRPPKLVGPKVTITHTVTRGTFEHDVVERGEVESSRNIEVRSEAKPMEWEGLPILTVIDEGSSVKKGDVVVQLDATVWDRELVKQKISVNTKKAAMIEAKNKYDAAVIAKREYVLGTFIQEQQTLQGEAIVAKEKLRRAQEYSAYSERLAARGYVTSQQLEGDAFEVEKAETELKTAETKLRVLRDFTLAKKEIELDMAIRTAEAQWKSEQDTYQLERDKQKDIEEQIARCTIRAPQDGQVIFANERGGRFGGEDFVVQPGTLVRKDQVILRLPDASQMQVLAKINEARITMVRPGMKATVRIDALGDATVSGVVTKVNEYPEPSSWFSSQIKEYATYIRIDDPPKRIRPGLTAEVTILINRVEDALTVPMQAIVEKQQKYYCVAQEGERWEPRTIQVASTNEKFALVREGIREGDIVALNPRAFFTEEEKPSPATRSTRPPGGTPRTRGRRDVVARPSS
ncbi:MAG TPA: HlyD family efflux transporter periplasmic adaptor subunit [Pirellulaceae bacterium]